MAEEDVYQGGMKGNRIPGTKDFVNKEFTWLNNTVTLTMNRIKPLKRLSQQVIFCRLLKYFRSLLVPVDPDQNALKKSDLSPYVNDITVPKYLARRVMK